MSNQGLYGALDQYWNIEPKVRLYRRNTFFRDHSQVSNWDALRLCVGVIVLALAILSLWCVGGVL